MIRYWLLIPLIVWCITLGSTNFITFGCLKVATIRKNNSKKNIYHLQGGGFNLASNLRCRLNSIILIDLILLIARDSWSSSPHQDLSYFLSRLIFRCERVWMWDCRLRNLLATQLAFYRVLHIPMAWVKLPLLNSPTAFNSTKTLFQPKKVNSPFTDYIFFHQIGTFSINSMLFFLNSIANARW
jgi:hypothetical protein